MMTIDPKTGVLKIGCDTITPSMRKQQFLDSAVGGTAKEVVRNGEWTTYTILIPDTDQNVALTIRFNNDCLFQVQFAILDSSEFLKTWRDTTGEDDKARVTSYCSPYSDCHHVSLAGARYHRKLTREPAAATGF
jgi:hypothetical protein